MTELTKHTNEGLWGTLEGSWLGKFIGYVWVCVFFYWTVLTWHFPEIHQQSLAFQIMRHLLWNMEIVQQ